MADEPLHDLTAAYALDALDERERAEYEAHLAGCERCRIELASLAEAAVTLAYGVDAPLPPPHLRQRIIEAAEAEAERTNVVPLRRRPVFQAVAGVAAVAAGLAIGLGVWAATLQHSVDRARTAQASQSVALAIVANPDAQRHPLSGATGTLVVDPDGRAALVVQDLPAAPAGRTYEAWIMGSGQPRPVGLFHGGGTTVFPLEHTVPDGTFVGVTIERSGGAAAPTGPPIARSRL